MTEEQLSQLRAVLEQELTDHLAQEQHEQEYEQEELDGVDNHPADEATELMDKMTDLAIDEFQDEEKEKIERALAAIEAGTYGTCEVCGESIPYERLEAIPFTLTCVEHA